MSHILRNYDEELSALKDTVVQMGTLVVAAIEKSVSGLLNRNLDLCYDVIDEDEVIDQHEKRIDEQGMAILLRFDPVASDLRHVLSSINIGRSLERIGDHAVTVAKRSRKILKAGELDETRLVEPLLVEVRRILSEALVAYSDRDEERALAVVKMDKNANQIHKSLGKALTQKISEGLPGTESFLNTIFISRSLKRIGDLAVNIGEDVVFSASAEDIRHT